MTEDSLDLRPWGYAPGWYCGRKCRTCDCRLELVDKRAISCRACATEARSDYIAKMDAPLVCDGVCNVPEA